MTFVTALTDAQQQVARWLPYPVAAAWHEVLVARGVVHLEQRVTTAIEVTARLLGVLAICDYLRGPPVPEVETLLQKLERPQPEDWLAILQACSRALHLRTEPKPFAPELVRWALSTPTMGAPGRDATLQPGPGWLALQKAVTLRGDRLRATMTEVAYDEAAQIDTLAHALLQTLDTLRWLGLYRLARVTELTTLRHGGFSGRVQIFAGGTQDPEPLDAAWTAHLLADVVYVLNAKATEALEVSPFLRVLPHPKSRRPVLFLLDSAPGLRRLQLASDTSGVMVETAIAGPDGEMSLAQWLQVRGEHGAWLANQDLWDVLATDARVGKSLERPPSGMRAVPELTVADFRPLPTRQHPSTALYLGPQRKRMVLIAQVAAVVALSVVSVKLLGTRARRHGATVAEDAPQSVVGPQHPQSPAQVAVAPADPVRPALPPAVAVPPMSVAVAEPAKPLPPAPTAVVQAAQPDPPLEVASAQPAQPIPPVQVASAPPAEPIVPTPVAPARPAQPVPVPPQPAVVLPPRPVPAGVAAPAHASPPAASAPTVAQTATPDFLQRGREMLEVRPTYALLQFAQAEEAHPGSAAEWLARLGQKPPADPATLTARLYQEATAIIYGPRHTPAQKRRMAKDLYGDAARRGLAKGYVGLAKIHLLGETNAAACRQDLEQYQRAGGTDTAEVKGLRGKCGN